MQLALRFVGLLLFVCAGITVNATTYYFSTTDGDDSRTSSQAQNASLPWKSLTKLAAVFPSLKHGDSVLFKRGDVFYGAINPTASGNPAGDIVLAAYGAGEKPTISGLVTFNGWSAKGGNVWEADASAAGDNLNTVLINGQFAAIGRYPNSNAAAGGYLTVDSYSGNNSITSSSLSSSGNWSGGEVVIRKNRWIVDRNKITAHNGNTINYASESGYYASTGYGYFIQNHPGTLDQDGEWYYQAKRLGVYLSSGNASSYTIQGSAVSVLVSIYNQGYLTFSGLAFSGANTNAFELRNAQNVSLLDCSISFSGVNAVDASGVQGFSIQGSEIKYTNNVAMNMNNCSGTVVQNNNITATGSIAGMGKGGDGTYTAILLNGNNNSIAGNSIATTGYIPISFNGSSVSVKNNFINGYTLVKDDGGGIYTWNNGSNPTDYTARTVTGNIILNGHSASDGTNDAVKKFSHGIYLDDNAANVDVSGNTVAACEGFGVYVHNARQIAVKTNTLYNNTEQLMMIEDDIAPNSPVRNTDVRGNVLFSLLPSQIVAEYKSRANDLSDFGNFDDNYYSRPADDNAVIGTLRNINGSYIYQPVDLEGWKAMSGKDAASKTSPKTFPTFTVNSFLSGNKYSNGSFDANVGGLYAFSPANNCQTSWNNGGLDGGGLAVNFSSTTNYSKGTIVIGVGAVTAGKKYLLRFSLKGGTENKMLEVYLRKSGSPYNDITDRKLVAVKGYRKEVSLLFTPTEATSDGSIGIDVPEQASAVYFDNIDLREVSATDINIADSVKFVYNATPAAIATALALSYIDVKNTAYSGSVTTAPFSSVVLLANSSVLQPPQVACSGTGTILREQWNNVDGNDVAQIPVNATPSSSGQITSFEGPVDFADKYGSRIRGYICPPQTGNYTFWIAGDDATELWLSTSDDPALKKKIAYNLNWTSFREWSKYASQKSALVYLEAGKKYYIEALHKEGAGGDNLSVAWQLPDGTTEAPVAGSHLSPFQVASLSDQTISFSSLQDFTLGNAPLTLSATASSGLPVSFSVASGAATVVGNVLTPTAAGVVVVKASQAGNAQYNAAPDVLQSLNVLSIAAVAQCTATGTILREQWDGVSGNDVAQIPLTLQPSSSGQLTSFEGPQNAADNYGSRIRGYICAPQTGNYTFYIAGDDATELWLSTDASPSNKTKIAYSLSWTAFREWNKYASQKSAAIYLEAGKKYYIEAMHKEGSGGDHLSVGWQLPGGSFEGPIAGNHLSPYLPVASATQCSATGLILREQWNNVDGNDVAQIPLNTAPSSSTRIALFEGPKDAADRYGSRIRGYLCPPQTGNYTFWIAGDDATELWLSTSDDVAAKTKIAYNVSWTNYREWNKYASQKSASIYLEAGKKYYVEALHKEGAGGDNLSVAWQLPDGTTEAPIGGSRLSPFVEIAQSQSNTVLSKTVANLNGAVTESAAGITAFPNPFTNRTLIEINPVETGSARIDVIDISGRVRRVLYDGVLQKNTRQQITLSDQNLSAGMYFVRYRWSKGFIVCKISKR